MPSHYRLMLLQSLLSTNHYEFLISLHDRSSQSRTKGPVARTTKSCLEGIPKYYFHWFFFQSKKNTFFASLFKVWWFPRAPWRDLIGNSNLPSRRSTQLFLVFARRLRLLSLPFLSFFRTICYFLTVIHLAEIAISGFWKWRKQKKTCFILMRSIISFQVCGCLYFIELFLRLLPQRWKTKQMKNSEQQNCVTQLKLYTGDKLSSSIFCCLWVSVWGIGNTQPNLHFSNIYRHTSPLLTLYHLKPSSTNLYWPSASQYCTIKYHLWLIIS